VQRSGLMPLLRAGLPIGLVTLLFTVLLRVDTVLISLLTNNRQVGIYGAAFRLLESTMFLSWSFGAALFPWLSRTHVENRAQLARGYEVGVTVMLALLTPIGVGFAILAEPIVHLIYGTTYDAAITPLRFLGVVVIAYGVNTLTNSALAAHDRPGLMHRVLLVTVVQNVLMNLVLIPPYGPSGAAVSAAVSGLLLGTLSIRQASVAFGGVRPLRVVIAPAAGAAAMTLAVLLVDGGLVEELVLGGGAYVVATLLVERILFPEDFARLLRLARNRSAA
jgi:O-antigen/teichoic acid export membrane protein